MTAPRTLATSPTTFRERDDWMRVVIGSDLAHAAVRVAVRIALYLHVNSGRCEPGYDTLATELRMSKRSIIRIVATLEQAGWLAVSRSQQSAHRNNGFTLLRGDTVLSPRSGDKALSPRNATGVTNSADRGDKFSHSGVTHAVTHNAKRRERSKRAGKSQTQGPDFFATDSSKDARPKNAKTAAKPKRAEIAAAFERFWSVYSRKIAKEAAAKVFARAVKGGTDPEMIIAGATRYAVERAGEPARYTANPANWLRDRRWTDEPAAGREIIDEHGNVVAVEQHEQQQERRSGFDVIAEQLIREGSPWAR